MKEVNIIECPRDAMQGWKTFIPTDKKIEYINALLKVGFDTIDFGSFVSAKALADVADTKQVLPHLEVHNSDSKLLAIVASTCGAKEACEFDQVIFVDCPFSVSP